MRFRHGSFVHDFVRDSIRESLVVSRPGSSLPLPAAVFIERGAQPSAELPFSEFSRRLKDQPWQDRSSEFPQPQTGAGPELLPEYTIQTPHQEKPLEIRAPETHGEFPAGAEMDAMASLDTLAQLRPLGQLHESFIIAAGRDGLWIVDQHVAHERVLFEKVMKQVAAGRVAMQRLLLPSSCKSRPRSRSNTPASPRNLNAAGFDTEPFGRAPSR